MTALDKTDKLQRLDLDVGLLEPNPLNPNRMTDAEFNMLYDNLDKTGLTDPILVRKVDGGKYRVIGGHHRLEVAKLHGFEKVPCTVIDDPEFDDDQEAFQLVRMNVIHGKMSPDAFMKLYNSLTPKYSDEIMQEAFGFAEEAEFEKLVKRTAKTLPKEMQEEFKKAAKEIKTIDGLAALLNRMFTDHGDTLETGYMVVDYGGKDSVWVRITPKTFKSVLAIGEMCREQSCTMDNVLGGILQLIASGKLSVDMSDLTTVKIPDALIDLPTIDNIAETSNGEGK